MSATSTESATHFSRARWPMRVPLDQLRIGFPRIGICGAMEGRVDLRLLEGVAQARPDWNIVIVGPVPDQARVWLDHARNVHRVGPKSWDELPAYVSDWDVALLPLVCSQGSRLPALVWSTRYLAAGRPVVATPVPELIATWGRGGVVRLAHSIDETVGAIAELLGHRDQHGDWLAEADAALARTRRAAVLPLRPLAPAPLVVDDRRHPHAA